MKHYKSTLKENDTLNHITCDGCNQQVENGFTVHIKKFTTVQKGVMVFMQGFEKDFCKKCGSKYEI